MQPQTHAAVVWMVFALNSDAVDSISPINMINIDIDPANHPFFEESSLPTGRVYFS